MTISPATRLYGVIGDPVSHSLSPLIHNRWLQQAGIDAVYVALHLQSADPAADIRSLARAGFSGLNITLPHKRAALEASEFVSPEAKAIGAANTLKREDAGGWKAHNTDAAGFFEALQAALGADVKGRRVVLVGAGGAARAAAYELTRRGASLAIVNRSKANADTLAKALAPGAETAELERLGDPRWDDRAASLSSGRAAYLPAFCTLSSQSRTSLLRLKAVRRYPIRQTTTPVPVEGGVEGGALPKSAGSSFHGAGSRTDRRATAAPWRGSRMRRSMR
jgi:hypothetical protein